MSVVLRLLLAICLAATALPAPFAQAGEAAHAAAPAHADAPPCHGGDDAGAPEGQHEAPAQACCDGGSGCCAGGCGCLQATGLPVSALPATTAAAPQGPRAVAAGGARPPRLAPPVRPPIG